MKELFLSETSAQNIGSYEYSQFKDYILLNDLQGREVRNIAISYVKSEYINNVKYLLVVGIDIFTQKFVRLVDTYGHKYGLCRYCDDYKEFVNKAVIQVPCKICDEYLNTLRLVGKAKILGQTDFRKLFIKVLETSPFPSGVFPYSYIDVPSFMQILKNNPNKEFFAKVFISSEIHLYKNKYQIKFSYLDANSFVDILDEKILNKNIDGKYIKGTALVKGIMINGNFRICVVKVHSHKFFDSKREYNRIALTNFLRMQMPITEKYIEDLLDMGYTIKSESFPITQEHYDTYYKEDNFIEEFFEFDSDYDYEECYGDYTLDYGYREDEDYEE